MSVLSITLVFHVSMGMDFISHLWVYNISKLTFIFLVFHRSLLCVCYEWTLYFYSFCIWLGFKELIIYLIYLSKLKTSSTVMNFSLSKIEFNRSQTITQIWLRFYNRCLVLIVFGFVHHPTNCCFNVKNTDGMIPSIPIILVT